MTVTPVLVIGGGPGGYAAAFAAADLGLQVTLVDTEPHPGGECLYRGCIPSKALLHVAKVMTDARQAAEWGVRFGEPQLDLTRLRSWKDGVVDKLTAGLGSLCAARKVRYVQGRAVFRDAHTARVERHDGAQEDIPFEHAILATGSHAATLPALSLDSPRLLNAARALELPDVPPTLLVVGGGYIGLELGSVYAALGSRVTVVEMTDGLLPGVDRDLVRVLHATLTARMHRIALNTTVASLEEAGDRIQVRFEGPDITGAEEAFDRVLVSVGRKPNSANLGLENTDVQVNDKGFVVVDAQRRTAEQSIFAIGDVAGEPMLAHKAAHEARTAVEVIAGQRSVFEPRAIPAVVFTDPEVAWCGVTEREAKANGWKPKVARFPWNASGRALTLGTSEGLTKLVIDPESERVLGVGIVGSGAGELIAEGVLAVEMAAVASDLSLTIHPHPTLSETIMEAADVFFGQSAHRYQPTGSGR